VVDTPRIGQAPTWPATAAGWDVRAHVNQPAALALAAPAVAAPAGHVAGPAVSGTEHFQIVSTNAAGNTGKLVFKNGSFKVHHKNGKGGTQKFDPKTCLAQITQPGTYTISGGTGKYAGISGHGKFRYRLLFIGARNAQGKCAQRKPPVASQLIIQASGPDTSAPAVGGSGERRQRA